MVDGSEMEHCLTTIFAQSQVSLSTHNHFNQIVNELQMTCNLIVVLSAKKSPWHLKMPVPVAQTNSIWTSEEEIIENVSSYKYLGIWIDDRLSFTVHVEHLFKKQT